MMQNALFTKKRRFYTRVRETVITNAVLSRNDGKHILHQKRRFGTRFRETVISNAVLSKNDAKAVLTQNDAKRTFHQKTSFLH